MNSIFGNLKRQSEGGFALVLAIVVMTLVLTAAAGLCLSRQMWAFSATKQLDRAMMEMQIRADAAGWLMSVRDTMQATSLDFSDPGLLELIASPSSTSTMGEVDNLFSAPEVYPEYPEPDLEGDSVFQLYMLYNPSLPEMSEQRTPNEPYWGTRSYVGSLGALFPREMSSEGRALRYDVLDSENSRMRAWASVDGALNATMNFRMLPVSGFTLFCSYAPEGQSSDLSLSANWIGTSNWAYTYGAYSSGRVGAGRYYIEGKVTPDTVGLLWGLPLVATDGVGVGAGTFNFDFPVHLGGGGIYNQSLTTEDFLKKRFVVLRNMLRTSQEEPSRLMRVNMARGTDGKWYPSPLTGGVLNLLMSRAAVTMRYIVASNVLVVQRYDPSLFDGGVSSERAALLSSSVWTVDVPSKELVFHPPAGWFDGFSKPPQSITVEFQDSNDWSLRVQVPSVSALSTTAANRKLALMSFRPIILERGFNYNGVEDMGSMVAGPSISVGYPNVSPVSVADQAASYSVRGMILAEAPSPEYPFLSWGGYTNRVDLTGSLVLWRRTSPDALARVPIKLWPSPGYLTGEKVPPICPAVTDVRISSTLMDLYRMRAVDSSTGDNDDDSGDDDDDDDDDDSPSPSPSPSPESEPSDD